jgi:hypothetical protein
VPKRRVEHDDDERRNQCEKYALDRLHLVLEINTVGGAEIHIPFYNHDTIAVGCLKIVSARCGVERHADHASATHVDDIGKSQNIVAPIGRRHMPDAQGKDRIVTRVHYENGA